jgi:hypothetical protein
MFTNDNRLNSFVRQPRDKSYNNMMGSKTFVTFLYS